MSMPDHRQRTANQPATRWGRSRFGGGPGLLVLMSLVLGGLLSAGGSWLMASLVEVESVNPVLMFWVAFACLLPPCIMVPWALLVDRNSLTGAVARPEESVESAWYLKASSGAFTDVLLVMGLGTTAVSITGVQWPTSLVGLTMLVLMMACFGVRYVHQKRMNA
ncbi:hypothetical protein [Citricoccus sp. GCM10030269]|uniref:hypothetical protein n=1 Tax=Citricoccus sp. GCM10030269 TaxID=3273388 RepID=UPI003608E75C